MSEVYEPNDSGQDIDEGAPRMIPEAYQPYAKALTGFIGTLATAVATTGADGELTGMEVLVAILGVIGVTTAVYQVKNRPPE